MRAISVALLAILLTAGGIGIGKASAQGLVEYALILTLVVKSDGPAAHHVQASSKFNEDCGTSSDLAAVCAAVDAIESGTPGAEAMARLNRAGAELVGSASVRSDRPLLIVAEDVEGEALGKPAHLPPPFRPIADVLFQATSDDGAVGLVGCDLSGEPLAAFVQEYRGDGKDRYTRPENNLDAETCADALQRQSLIGHELAHVVLQVTPVKTPRGIRIAAAHIGSRGKPGSSAPIGKEEVGIVHEYIVRTP